MRWRRGGAQVTRAPLICMFLHINARRGAHHTPLRGAARAAKPKCHSHTRLKTQIRFQPHATRGGAARRGELGGGVRCRDRHGGTRAAACVAVVGKFIEEERVQSGWSIMRSAGRGAHFAVPKERTVRPRPLGKLAQECQGWPRMAEAPQYIPRGLRASARPAATQPPGAGRGNIQAGQGK